MGDTDPIIGTSIDDKFVVQSLLNEGGTSIIYLAVQRGVDRPAAIKVLRPELTADANQVLRMKREAKAIAALNHPHIVNIIGSGELQNGQPYLALELLDGKTLAEIIDDEGPMPWQRAVPIFSQICDVMQYAHQQGIIDRDLSPNNIMLVNSAGRKDFVKLLDLGLLKYDESMRTESHKLTVTGDVMGNPMYISPEQALAEPVDERTDIYSLGAIMWETLAGQPLFSGKNVGEIMSKHAYTPATPLSAARKDIGFPRPLEELVMKCLQKKPSQRVQSMQELKTALAICSGGAAVGAAGKDSTANTMRDLMMAALAIVGAAVVICTIMMRVLQR